LLVVSALREVFDEEVVVEGLLGSGGACGLGCVEFLLLSVKDYFELLAGLISTVQTFNGCCGFLLCVELHKGLASASFAVGISLELARNDSSEWFEHTEDFGLCLGFVDVSDKEIRKGVEFGLCD